MVINGSKLDGMRAQDGSIDLIKDASVSIAAHGQYV